MSEVLFALGVIDDLEHQIADLLYQGAGTRQLLEMPWCADLAKRMAQHEQLAPLLPLDPVAVQCTYFEKSLDQNWLVPLHQDLSIPVAEKVDHPELTGWSEKEGRYFVQPPIAVLEQLVAVRLHIDDCGEEDGALKVVPRSHRLGRLSGAAASSARDQFGETTCSVPKGAALIMRPLVLHASSKATGLSKRRILHFLYGPASLSHGLRWHHVMR
ncbi:phytanoyl-CoA dioxygenase family protein [Undibacterium sp. Xuan67W]|uniref:phytanoyl-CoA dioxygenase family protein n=1 Tax=Undibacterium sp. Xuan67W TaxID=3413057 RepID=UPI003BF029B4